MRGVVAVEEATIDPGSVSTIGETIKNLIPGLVDIEAASASHAKRLLDLHGDRLRIMDEQGVEYMLLAHTSPGCQGQTDPRVAQEMAVRSNNWLSEQVKANPARFGALAALSMHDPVQAAAELKRGVQELGFFGGLVNDYQSVGADGAGRVYYDTKDYDPFWQVVEELDVPIYFHPRYPPSPDLAPAASQYGKRGHLLGAGVQFHLDLSWHIYAVCSGGRSSSSSKLRGLISKLHLWHPHPFSVC